MIIFLDESGDLGFDFGNKTPSPAFTITLLVCDNRSVLQSFKSAVKRTLKNKLNHRKCLRRVKELKGSDTAGEIKSYFMRHSPPSDWRLYSVTLNKYRVEPHLQSKQGKKKLYNFLARFILEKIPFDAPLDNVTLVVDKCKNSEEIKDFNQYIEQHMEALLPLSTRLYISHEHSHNNSGLQAVDMFCWGFARRYSGDSDWYQQFESYIAFDTIYLPKI